MENIHHTIKSSVMGQLIGDSVGYPFSYMSIPANKVDMVIGPNEEPAGSYQGPSSLSLCTMASIIEYGEINLNAIMDKFNDFVLAGYLGCGADCSDLSEITIAAIKNYSNGMPAEDCGPQEDENNDNECLARILPVGLFFAFSDVDTIVSNAHNVCRITHGHVKSQVVCALYCLIIRSMLTQKSGKVFGILKDYYKTKEMTKYSEALESLKDANEVVENSDSGRSVDYCFWSAWTSHAKYENDFRLCVTSAVAHGGDANSTGAIAGAMSGLVNGIENMPKSWLNTIKLSTEVMEVIEEFTDLVTRKSS